MLKLKRIAITGGIASGKTSACRIFQELGAFVVEADAIVHDLLSHDINLRQQIVQRLGSDVLVNGQLSRKMIADKVFKDPEALHALEKLLHPAVLSKIEELYQQACNTNAYFAFVVESPLLFEINEEKSYDIVVAVVANPTISRDRFVRKGFHPDEYEQRMKRQLPIEEKARRADYVIENNGSIETFRKQIIALSRLIQKPTNA